MLRPVMMVSVTAAESGLALGLALGLDRELALVLKPPGPVPRPVLELVDGSITLWVCCEFCVVVDGIFEGVFGRGVDLVALVAAIAAVVVVMVAGE